MRSQDCLFNFQNISLFSFDIFRIFFQFRIDLFQFPCQPSDFTIDTVQILLAKFLLLTQLFRFYIPFRYFCTPLCFLAAPTLQLLLQRPYLFL